MWGHGSNIFSAPWLTIDLVMVYHEKKILREGKPSQKPFSFMMMSNNRINHNGVNETGTDGEGLSPVRDVGGQQPVPGRHPATARDNWTKDIYKLVIRCFFKSEPKRRGYRKRMLAIWREIGVFDVTEQRLADQSRAISTNGWLSEVELEEIKRQVEGHDEREVLLETMPEENTEFEIRILTGENEEPIMEEAILDKMRADGQPEEKIQLVREIIKEKEKKESGAPDNLRRIERSS